MAKSANSKVVFVPMQLQSDVVGQMASQNQQIQAAVTTSGATPGPDGLSNAGRAGLLSSMADV